MLPVYKPGDHVLTFNWGELEKGDVVVFRFPVRHDKKGTLYIKRVDKISGNRLYLSGDNKKESAKVNPISRGQIVGKIILKY